MDTTAPTAFARNSILTWLLFELELLLFLLFLMLLPAGRLRTSRSPTTLSIRHVASTPPAAVAAALAFPPAASAATAAATAAPTPIPAILLLWLVVQLMLLLQQLLQLPEPPCRLSWSFPWPTVGEAATAAALFSVAAASTADSATATTISSIWHLFGLALSLALLYLHLLPDRWIGFTRHSPKPFVGMLFSVSSEASVSLLLLLLFEILILILLLLLFH